VLSGSTWEPSTLSSTHSTSSGCRRGSSKGESGVPPLLQRSGKQVVLSKFVLTWAFAWQNASTPPGGSGPPPKLNRSLHWATHTALPSGYTVWSCVLQFKQTG